MKLAIVHETPGADLSLRRALALDPRLELAWTAAAGQASLQVASLGPVDLLLMQLEMPEARAPIDVLGGVELTRRLMQQGSAPAILLVTDDVERNMPRVFQAMGHGAVDVVAMPGAQDAYGAGALLQKIQSIAWVIGLQAGSARQPQLRRAKRIDSEPRLVAIGASAGGPAALLTLLRALPRDYAAAVLVVQHVDEQFAGNMAAWLGSESDMAVRLARAGDRPIEGQVLLAGSSQHLRLQDDGSLGYAPEPADAMYSPSIDVFFDSIVDHWPGLAAGVLLTGMGRDGARGLLHMRERGFRTIAQDQASSTVYGMPKAAAEIGAAAEILPLERIAPRLAELFE